MKVTKWLNSYVLPNATAPHLDSTKTGKAQCEHMFSASPLRADIAQCRRHVRFVPKSELCVDGDVGLTARSEAALEPPRFISRMLTCQAYICPSSSLVMVPGLHPMALRAW
jgi:hypothetical protein